MGERSFVLKTNYYSKFVFILKYIINVSFSLLNYKQYLVGNIHALEQTNKGSKTFRTDK